MGRQSGFYFNSAGVERNPANKIQDLPNNLKFKMKNIGGNYSGGQTSKAHHLLEERQTEIPIHSPAGANSNSIRQPIVPFQALPVAPFNQPLLLQTKKRNLELEPVEDDKNPNCSPWKKLIPMELALPSSSGTPSAENGGAEAVQHSDLTKRKAVMAGEGGCKAASQATKQYLCASCNKEFDSYFALGGHRAIHVREERRLCRYSPPWAASLYGKQPRPRQDQQHYCPWCKKAFSKQQGLAAHSRFCRRKKELMLIGHQKPPVARDFDLNELPPEAFFPEEIFRLTWH